MALGYFSYRWLNRRNYDAGSLKCYFITIMLIAVAVFAGAGGVCLWLYVRDFDYYNNYNCSDCTSFGATVSCGDGWCCFPGDPITLYSYSYCYDGTDLTTLWLILFISFFCYAVYELILMFIFLCNGAGMLSRNRRNVVVVENQMGNYSNQQYNNGQYTQNYGNYGNNPNYANSPNKQQYAKPQNNKTNYL